MEYVDEINCSHGGAKTKMYSTADSPMKKKCMQNKLKLLDAQVLMIDDLGSEPLMQNVTVEQLFLIINRRQELGRSTAISTNLSTEEFRARYTERIASRMMDSNRSRIIILKGKDLRQMRTNA